MRRLRSRRALSWGALLFLLLLLLLRGPRLLEDLRPTSAPPPAAAGWYSVTRVIDGDTLVVVPNPSPELREGTHVRLIGVDAPEMAYSPAARIPGQADPFAVEATGYVRHEVEGKNVRLEFGPERGDRYGRTLAYVYLEDGTLLNAEIIRHGYARAYRRFPHPLRDEFLLLEEQARAAGVGLWAEESEPVPAR